jgi:RNA recognition motif-containing protein
MNLYIGNLAPNVMPADLQHIFGGMGEILYAKLAQGEEDRSDRGYAFVYVPNDDKARTVVASLHGTLLKGEKLTVSPMVERPGVIGGVTSKSTG